MRMAVIIAAAGAGGRYASAGGMRSKLDEDLGGRPVLQRTVELFVKRDEVCAIIVAGPHDDETWGEFQTRHQDRLAIHGVTLVKGGVTHRWETVRAGLDHVPEDATHVAVHDGARPAAPAELIDRVFEFATKHPAVVPGVEVSDTLKRVGAEETDKEIDPISQALGIEQPQGPSLRPVEQTIDRSCLMAVQTPQVFEVALLRRAYGQDELDSTDDAQLVERLGEPVVVIEGDIRNVKITRPVDLALARAVLGVKKEQGRPTHKRF